MIDLSTWLSEQIADDAKAFQFARDHDGGDGHLNSAEIASCGGGFIELHCSRMLADCEAKQRIIELHFLPEDGIIIDGEETVPVNCAECLESYPCPTIRLLSMPFSDRSGYRPEWIAR